MAKRAGYKKDFTDRFKGVTFSTGQVGCLCLFSQERVFEKDKEQ